MLLCVLLAMTTGQMPTLAKPVTFRPNYKDKPLTEIVEEIEKKSGLMFISRRGPTGNITLKVDRDVTATELIWLLNEELEPRGVSFVPRTVSFSFIAEEDLDPAKQYGGMWKWQMPAGELDQLDRYHKLEYRAVVFRFANASDMDEATRLTKKLLGKFGEKMIHSQDGWVVQDQVKNLRAIRDALGDKVKK